MLNPPGAPRLHRSDCDGCEYCTGVSPFPNSRTPTMPSPSVVTCKADCAEAAGRYYGLCDRHAARYMPAPIRIGEFTLSMWIPEDVDRLEGPRGRPRVRVIRGDMQCGAPITSEEARVLAVGLAAFADALEKIEANMEVP